MWSIMKKDMITIDGKPNTSSRSVEDLICWLEWHTPGMLFVSFMMLDSYPALGAETGGGQGPAPLWFPNLH